MLEKQPPTDDLSNIDLDLYVEVQLEWHDISSYYWNLDRAINHPNTHARNEAQQRI